jgi:hypothetical protein
MWITFSVNSTHRIYMEVDGSETIGTIRNVFVTYYGFNKDFILSFDQKFRLKPDLSISELKPSNLGEFTISGTRVPESYTQPRGVLVWQKTGGGGGWERKPVSPKDLAMIVTLGFSESLAARALAASNNDVSLAIRALTDEDTPFSVMGTSQGPAEAGKRGKKKGERKR